MDKKQKESEKNDILKSKNNMMSLFCFNYFCSTVKFYIVNYAKLFIVIKETYKLSAERGAQ
jgi:hypothetical protein